MKSSSLIKGLSVTALVAIASSVFADGVQDYYAQNIAKGAYHDQLAQGGRTLGMGGSSIVTSSNSTSIIGNPAGLGWMKDAELSGGWSSDEISGNDIANYGDVKTDASVGHALLSLPLVPYLQDTPEYGSVGFGWTGFDTDGNDTTDLEFSGYSLNLAYGKDVSSDLSLGYAIAHEHREAQFFGVNEDDNGVRQTLGVQYKVSPETLFGSSVFVGTGLNNSWGLDGGFSHLIAEGTTFAYSVDYTHYDSDFDGWNFRTGIEQALTSWLKGRVGYRYSALLGDTALVAGNTKNVKDNAVSFGVGVALTPNLNLDYGAEYRGGVGDGDWTHLVSASAPFSLCREAY